ncbi:head-tail adaptor protein [Aestuariivita sp.]|jgi:head-tail adaptor|uniref:head-tail adaptor protein n=1 Tax=Aestuariivita sp. TaxID=1872407 RepID=UPI002172B961|nr:head-tail adaptor protein [Aestuariivita sp.]MCE8006599.1 head-tail adaptor protein [Aestuariivita sp.]
MKVPHLNRKLVLESPERAPDGAGGYSETWVALGELWAGIQSRSGRERTSGTATVATVPLKIVVRGAPYGAASHPQPGQRFREGTRIYAITAVTEWDGHGRYLTCFAQEEVVA